MTRHQMIAKLAFLTVTIALITGACAYCATSIADSLGLR